MTESEGEHRRATERAVIDKAFAEGRFGQICAVAVALAAIAGTTYIE